MNVNLNRQILDNGKIYVWAEGLGFTGWVPSPIPPKPMRPYLDWGGGKITMDVWQTILAFFKKHDSNEVQVRLYYNPETKEWKAWAFPQSYPTGMTTRELPEHPNTAEDSVMFPDPWVRMGSVHHHCSANAFQSGTDSADEATVPGLHITMGALKHAKWDIHSRTCIRIPGRLDSAGQLLYPSTQGFYEANLSQWFDLPATWKAILPAAVQSETLKLLLCMPPDNADYPDRWNDNLIRSSLPNGHHHHHAPYNPNNNHTGYRSSAPSSTPVVASVSKTGDGKVETSGSWEQVSPKKLEIILGLVEAYYGQDGKFLVQVVETSGWKNAGFHSQLACEQILRAIGFIQVTPFMWSLPQDKALAEAAARQADEEEAKEDQLRLAQMHEHEAAIMGIGHGGD